MHGLFKSLYVCIYIYIYEKHNLIKRFKLHHYNIALYKCRRG